MDIRRTKIVCTIGPATNTKEKIIELISAGMNVARLNFSHGTHEDHRGVIAFVREASAKLGKHIAILQDLQGPKIRVGDISVGKIRLKDGEKFTITIRNVPGDEKIVSTTYKNLPDDLQPDNKILLDDGLIELKVLRCTDTDVICEVINGGYLSSHKGINLPGIKVSSPSLTEKDIEDLEFGLAHDVDFIAMSFVRSSQDVKNLRKIISQKGKNTSIVAKIEKAEALEDIDNIISASDCVMIARGDLGVEIGNEHVPPIQKQLIAKCNSANRPVITATQMLESMVNNPRPTRAEASDVANAVVDGTDAVMLSAETATGKYPIEAVKIMDKVIRNIESEIDKEKILIRRRTESYKTIGEAIASGVCQVAEKVNAKLVVCLTSSGLTAVLISKNRPQIPILAITDNEMVLRKLNIVWGVESAKITEFKNTDECFKMIEDIIESSNFVQLNDLVVLTAGIPTMSKGSTNMLKVHKVQPASNLIR